MGNISTKYWVKVSLLNLLFVAMLGVLMRFKIGFEFPYFSQRFLHEAHSHFAFVGWITHTLYVLMINFIQSKIPVIYHKQYKILITANLVCAYGMLISFIIRGYGVVSILFLISTISIACFYAFYFLKDLKKLKGHPGVVWFKSAVWFNIISALGTFYLAYMLASGNFNEKWYLAAEYFYLHFQYNGFFIFTCMGLAHSQIQKALPTFKHDKTIFKLFFVSFIPAYFLSILWAKLPIWLYIIVVISAFVQVIAWIQFLIIIRKSLASKTNLTKLTQYLFLFVAIAFSTKLLLQLGSTIPVVSKLAFGFRPVVIAYLHLVLLAVISVFLLSYLHAFKLINQNKLSILGLIIFVAGVFLNELVLAIQGIASFSYMAVPKVNETLFIISLIVMSALVLLVVSQSKLVVKSKVSDSV